MLNDSRKIEKLLLDKIFTNESEVDYETVKKECKELLKEKYTDGKVSGVINKLVKNNVIIRTERGIYKKNCLHINDVDIEQIVKSIFNKAILEINAEVSKINPFNLTEGEFKSLQKIKKDIIEIEEKFGL
ncbi:TPA: hypothetical protein ACG3R3_003814 [Clostridioides difficile]